MSRIPIPMVGGAYSHRSLSFDAQVCRNLYPEMGGAQSKGGAALLRRPGLLRFLTVSGTGAIRGMYPTSTGRLFVVRGTNLAEVSAAGVETSRGVLNTAFGVVSMTDNGITLVIGDGAAVYGLTLANNTLAIIGDADCPDATPVLNFIDGYIFGFDPNAAQIGTFQHSDLNDATAWLSTDVYVAEGSPDRLVSQIANGREVWNFGSQSYEVWYNTGDATRTWARIPGAFGEIGCAATHSVAKIAGSVFWLGASKEGNGTVWRSNGYSAVRISTHPIESDIASFSNISNAVGFTYQQEGHQFYVLSFQTGDRTWVYDLTTNEWSEWAYRNVQTGEPGRHRAISHVFFNGKNYVGDYADGRVYELSLSTYTDDGDPITWERAFPHFEDKKQRIYWHSIQVDFETGVGLTSGQGSNPLVQLRWSDDGGRSWSNWHNRTLGAIGEYRTRVIWRRLGQSRSRVWSIRGSDPVRIAINDTTIAEVTSE